MRVPKLRTQTRTRLLALGLILIGLSTAAGLAAPQPRDAHQDAARVHANAAPSTEPCTKPG